MMGWRDIVRTHDEEKEVTKKQGGEEITGMFSVHASTASTSTSSFDLYLSICEMTEKKTWSYFELSDYKVSIVRASCRVHA